MNTKKLANNLLILGIVLLIAAVCWWASFYGPIAHKLGVDLMRADSCLYSNGGLCKVAVGIAQLAGQTPYNPIVCWLGAGCAAVGALLKLS
ncbi:MAG: hypothetical protein P4L91_14890 [Burkholderiaceae bacterium]|nr:hypothetical protein [Burkholderiaceae bacterium]